ncbi:MAG: YceI family protein [Cyclobacteriaceae bacterium]
MNPLKNILLTLGLTLSCINLSAQETVPLVVEPNHSTIGFSVPIAGGITRVTGKFMKFDLRIDYVNQDITQSKVQFGIDLSSIVTGIPERDEHLLTADFFDAERHPRIEFRAIQIKKSESGFVANGLLTMHGIEQVVEIPFQLLSEQGNQLGIEIRWQLDRLDFGVGKDFKHTSMENFLSNVIDIEINFWTKRGKDTP